MGIIYWICLRIIKADFTPSFKVGNFNFFESAAAIECIFADRGDKIVLFYNFVIYCVTLVQKHILVYFLNNQGKRYRYNLADGFSHNYYDMSR